MYQAIGRKVIKNADGSFTVRAEIIDDRTGNHVRDVDYTASSLVELRRAVAEDLKALAASETDLVLSKAIIGVQLGSV